MADTVRIIRLSYENGVRFKMDTKLNSGAYVTILEMDENGDIASLWSSAQQLCEKYAREQLTAIGKVMREE